MKKQTIILTTILSASSVFSSVQDLKGKILETFKQADYVQTLKLLQKLPSNERKNATPYYMEGLCHYQLQKYEKANEAFAKTIRFREHPQDSHYYYAQSLLASGHQNDAKEQFKSSYRSAYQGQYSKYYVSFIDKEMNHTHEAKAGFHSISRDKNFDTELRQPANHEYAKILLSELEKQENPEEKQVLVVYNELENAYSMSSSSPIASDIDKDMMRLDLRYKLNKRVFSNGMEKPKKNFFLGFSEDFSYDTNVATLSDNSANNTPTDTASMISKTTGRANYKYYVNGDFYIIPDIELTYLKHTNSSSDLVYRNDSFVGAFSLLNTYNHKLFDKAGFASFDIAYSSTSTDRDAEKTLKNWGTNTSFKIGESISYFDFGMSIVNFKHTIFDAYDESLDNTSNSLTFLQFYNVENDRSYIFTFNYTGTDSQTDTSDTTTYLLRADYNVPELYPTWTFNFGFGLTLTDPIESRDTRGLEKTYNPSAKATKTYKNIFDNHDLFFTVKYDYTYNSSEDTDNYQYTKHQIGVVGDLFF